MGVFSGLIEDMGLVEGVTAGEVSDIWIRSRACTESMLLGQSISVDGACLTVVQLDGQRFRVQAAPETLRRTTLGALRAGAKVNLERALRLGDRLGGHLVQGHVDGVAEIVSIRPEGGSRVVRFSLPSALAPFLVEKGSIAVDGISLTVVNVDEGSFSVMLIPETLARTTLVTKGVGAAVNLEADLIGKYVARLCGLSSTRPQPTSQRAAGERGDS